MYYYFQKKKNDSNEVAITCDLESDNPLNNFGVSMGTEHEVDILKRDKDYDYKKAFHLFRECIDGLGENSPTTDLYFASLTFLAKCSESGLFYR